MLSTSVSGTLWTGWMSGGIMFKTLFIGLLALTALVAQRRVDRGNLYERAMCIVPMVGSGSPADSRRPAYVPLPAAPGAPTSPNGIIGFSYQMSDDGQFALLELVARDRSAFNAVL